MRLFLVILPAKIDSGLSLSNLLFSFINIKVQVLAVTLPIGIVLSSGSDSSYIDISIISEVSYCSWMDVNDSTILAGQYCLFHFFTTTSTRVACRIGELKDLVHLKVVLPVT